MILYGQAVSRGTHGTTGVRETLPRLLHSGEAFSQHQTPRTPVISGFRFPDLGSSGESLAMTNLPMSVVEINCHSALLNHPMFELYGSDFLEKKDNSNYWGRFFMTPVINCRILKANGEGAHLTELMCFQRRSGGVRLPKG